MASFALYFDPLLQATLIEAQSVEFPKLQFTIEWQVPTTVASQA